MSGYDYGAFLEAVRLQRRTAPTGCWVCDILESAHPHTVARCERISGGIVDAHHVIPKQTLKREFPDGVVNVVERIEHGYMPVGWQRFDARLPYLSMGPSGRRSLDDLLMDPRNGLLARRYHHDQLESRHRAIPLDRLPEETLEFASEIGLMWWLENQETRRGLA